MSDSTPFTRLMAHAYKLARPLMKAPPRGIAYPFGIRYSEDFQWRMSPDVWETLAAQVKSPLTVATSPLVDTLFGIVIERDFDAPDGTLELVDRKPKG